MKSKAQTGKFCVAQIGVANWLASQFLALLNII
jgi:hypothetical protein